MLKTSLHLSLILLVFCIALINISTAMGFVHNETAAPHTGVDNLPYHSGERLNYKLSYRGLLTSMLWVDIANAQMSFNADVLNYNQFRGHQYSLWVTTEHFKKAELIHAVRYRYSVMLDHHLNRALLVEEQDNGISQEHEILWLDWINNKTELYKRREKESKDSGLFRQQQPEKWEADGSKALPAFLAARGSLDTEDKSLSYFIHKETGDDIRHQHVIDPLSLIYKLRQPEFILENSTDIAVAIGDDVRIYRVQQQGMEMLEVNSQTRPAWKYLIHTISNRDKAFYVWLSDDRQRIPLKFLMEAPLGKLVVTLQD